MTEWHVKFVSEPTPRYFVYQDTRKGDVIEVPAENEADAMHIAAALSMCGAKMTKVQS